MMKICGYRSHCSKCMWWYFFGYCSHCSETYVMKDLVAMIAIAPNVTWWRIFAGMSVIDRLVSFEKKEETSGSSEWDLSAADRQRFLTRGEDCLGHWNYWRGWVPWTNAFISLMSFPYLCGTSRKVLALYPWVLGPDHALCLVFLAGRSANKLKIR
jgi:hypothetical protein